MSDLLSSKMFDTSGNITMPTLDTSITPSTEIVSDMGGIVSPVEESMTDLDEATTEFQDFADTFNAPDITIDPETLIATDQDGNVVADFSHLKDQLTELQGMSVPDLSTWMDSQGYEFGTLENLQDLMTELIEDVGTIDEEEQQEATDYAASAFGLGTDEYTDLLNQLTTDLTTEDAIGGYSDEQMAAYNKAISRDIANQYAAANKLVNNVMASTGSATRALAAADNYTNSINDYAIQSRTQLIEDDFAAQQANIASQQSIWNTLVTTGQLAESEYLSRMMEAEATALTGYATQMNAVLNENSQYLEMYQADLNAINLSMEITYNGIMAELGVDEALASAVQTEIENYYTDFNTTADLLATNITIAQDELDTAEANADDTISTVFQVLELAVSIIGMALGG